MGVHIKFIRNGQWDSKKWTKRSINPQFDDLNILHTPGEDIGYIPNIPKHKLRTYHAINSVKSSVIKTLIERRRQILAV